MVGLDQVGELCIYEVVRMGWMGLVWKIWGGRSGVGWELCGRV